MSRWTWALSLSLVLVVGCGGSLSEEGLVGHWKLNGTCEDSSGYGNDGEGLGIGFGYLDRDGAEYAAILNGIDHTVQIPDSDSIEPAREITISAWVKPDRIKGWMGHQIYRKEDGNEGRQLFAFKRQGQSLAFGLVTGGQYSELHATVYPYQITNDKWHLVTATYDGSTKKVYLDGKKVGSQTASGPIGTGGDAYAFIGSSCGNYAGGSEFYDGAIDDVRMYNKALSEDEIMDLYCMAAPNLICHLKFDGSLEDSSTSNIDGKFKFTILDWAAKPIGNKEDAEGATETYIESGTYGNAVWFNGRNESVNIPDSEIMEPQDEITISIRFRPDRVDDHVGHQLYRKEEGDDNRQMLAIKKQGYALTFGLTTGGKYKELEAPTDAAKIKDGNWHTVTATYDGSMKKVYLDGELLDETRASGMISSKEQEEGNGRTFIGSSCGKGEFYKGGIDDFRMYDCALTAEQVKHMAK